MLIQSGSLADHILEAPVSLQKFVVRFLPKRERQIEYSAVNDGEWIPAEIPPKCSSALTFKMNLFDVVTPPTRANWFGRLNMFHIFDRQSRIIEPIDHGFVNFAFINVSTM